MTPDRKLDCDAVVRQLWDYLDEELTEDRMAAIREHLSTCAKCYPHFEFEQAFLDTLARVQRDHPDLNRVREKVIAALRAEGFESD